MNEIKQKIEKICIDSKKATENIANIDCSIKNKILNEVIKLIKKNQARIIKANQKDLRLAKENHLSASKIDRLTLDETKINGLINSIREIIKMPDPIGKILYQSSLENGLNIKRISTPIGVMLYQ
jgi:glutamate-5-semialdehyde dehydrogenase